MLIFCGDIPYIYLWIWADLWTSNPGLRLRRLGTKEGWMIQMSWRLRLVRHLRASDHPRPRIYPGRNSHRFWEFSRYFWSMNWDNLFKLGHNALAVCFEALKQTRFNWFDSHALGVRCGYLSGDVNARHFSTKTLGNWLPLRFARSCLRVRPARRPWGKVYRVVAATFFIWITGIT